LGVSVQNFTQPGGRADFLRHFICSRVFDLMRFLAADQKQQSVNVCEELRQIASDDATFLSRVITGDALVARAGFTVMILRQSNNPPNGKVQTH
jgi:hypothetical protein